MLPRLSLARLGSARRISLVVMAREPSRCWARNRLRLGLAPEPLSHGYNRQYTATTPIRRPHSAHLPISQIFVTIHSDTIKITILMPLTQLPSQLMSPVPDYSHPKAPYRPACLKENHCPCHACIGAQERVGILVRAEHGAYRTGAHNEIGSGRGKNTANVVRDRDDGVQVEGAIFGV